MNKTEELVNMAIKCDNAGRLLEAHLLYTNILGKLLQDSNCDAVLKDKEMHQSFAQHIQSYVQRSEHIEKHLKEISRSRNVVDYIFIENDDTNCGYETILGKYLKGDKIKELLLEETRLESDSDFEEAHDFFEFVCRRCKKLKFIKLITQKSKTNTEKQFEQLEQLREELSRKDIDMIISFNDVVGAKILVNTGYVIRIDRGLHFYQPANKHSSSKKAHGYSNRKCNATCIEIALGATFMDIYD
ncbi:uncharacterized protein LOC119687055 [Teleopsis dalmanni]|uniref:uncharacterized protein LOC119687055 n=1 Tax=Teleopsis dalmanni TaxID=139649 RepID=UPI000D329594|nr:uncharacterized protein LOC119687055 [Teleopsis dalmanni]XP_037957140.1 uncharacterized protein LOC119687055 [Teleopsis dalmanni]XP_037957141.1 uncharacterized protein LOC119687055 [Teleopsis dalmanni]XP_037957142.1 uncharacterized protein LOC119687055 [Teleopsis dalmanni]XP_037957143.1 uncharacterized protein LOC119687055 [Teleopsis dalmanni]XP_037957144.1 uncharacterized protein LOC119687055 [Teleopsis dalmanni]XP_037957145.1 uncharacterized protein LOC119687055 [Teleopsis dalmanni]